MYLLLLSVLPTPLVGWLQPRRVRLGLAALAVVFGATLALALPLPAHLRADRRDVENWANLLRTAQFLLIMLVLLFALVAAFDAHRRAEAGSVQRARSRAFLVSFSIRDALTAVGLALIVTGVIFGEEETGTDAPFVVALGDNLTRLGTIVSTPLLAYGILRTQLFDIDLRIRLGFQAGTIAAVFVIVVFVTFKLTEFYLTGALGYGAGALAAGLLLFITPRLNATVEHMAKRAVPASAPSPEYFAFRKLEVYKAAVESALETGPLDLREREMLDRLRTKLGLRPADAAAIEADLTPSP